MRKGKTAGLRMGIPVVAAGSWDMGGDGSIRWLARRLGSRLGADAMILPLETICIYFVIVTD